MQNTIIWAIICVACLVFEFVTVGDLVTIWFALGAFVSCIVSAFGFSSTTVEIIIFVVISFVALLALRPICLKALKSSTEKTNIESIIGSKVKIIDAVTPDKMGSAKLDGVIWSVVNENPDEEILTDTYCEVVEIQGNKLVVKPKKEN